MTHFFFEADRQGFFGESRGHLVMVFRSALGIGSGGRLGLKAQNFTTLSYLNRRHCWRQDIWVASIYLIEFHD
jgi:hypothetical protein